MEYIRTTYKNSQQEFLHVIKFVLGSTFFKFNDKIYKQIFGAFMGSLLSPIIADLILQNLKSHLLITTISPYRLTLQTLRYGICFLCHISVPNISNNTKLEFLK